ncbi:hypothetical protein LTR53_018374, partial [Teratosphaeriaceae sp. CCFEE 6253]
LADACTKAQLIAAPSQLAEFARGFTQGRALFDFVDVGHVRTTSVKVAQTLELLLHDYHCRQILLGCSNDGGYARLLEQYAESGEALQRITLLEGLPLEKEIAAMPFPRKKFTGIFRDTHILTDRMGTTTNPEPFRPRIDSRGLNAASEVFTPTRTGTPLSPLSRTNTHRLSDQDSLPQHMRTTSTTSISSDASNGNSWATVAKSSAARPLAEVTRSASTLTSTSVVKEIFRNRA